ncbi:aminotransferase class I/II-fold pyridoxal phosphate-dependent enzyme [Clostridium fermenticellae]|uniref:Aminotransferase class I/II-fold pyridoxal phosphate-dependent enzyme n=1 Tax=Clostridium fermenticellae TaxID=2068654 RepID=A0A386H3U9_9CLOT|nr:aminotransferase class I/II-fold pyridoxal phosphate-dependent enzyme [Clostridium fermenticellae]
MLPFLQLADFLDVNVSTVSKAFRLCEMKGLLSTTVGRGTFVSYDAPYSGNLMIHHDKDDVINMGPTAPEPSGNAILLNMAQEMLSETGAERLFSYFAPGADEWQKEAAVQLMSYCGHHTQHDQILFAGGGQNALTAILAAMFHKGDKIAVDAHTYPGIKTAAIMLGIHHRLGRCVYPFARPIVWNN